MMIYMFYLYIVELGDDLSIGFGKSVGCGRGAWPELNGFWSRGLEARQHESAMQRAIEASNRVRRIDRITPNQGKQMISISSTLGSEFNMGAFLGSNVSIVFDLTTISSLRVPSLNASVTMSSSSSPGGSTAGDDDDVSSVLFTAGVVGIADRGAPSTSPA